MRTVSLVYAIAALVSTLPPLTNQDGTPYAGPAPANQPFTVTFSDPVVDAGVRASYTLSVAISGIDLTKLGADSNTWSTTCATSASAMDLAEAQVDLLLHELGVAPAVQYPPGLQGAAGGFLTFPEFASRYSVPMSVISCPPGQNCGGPE